MSTMQSMLRLACPYPGLRPYLRDESDIFFGREEQVDEILERLAHQRFLALVGTSGCGKSSLARAGITPALETGLMAKAGFRWRVATMRPGEQPLNNLLDALLEPGVLGPCRGAGVQSAAAAADDARIRVEARPFVLASLRRGPLGLTEVLCESLIPGAGPALPEKENLLLIVDQFEEIFRFAREGNRDEAEAFVATLLATVRADLPVYVVLTMRSDYLGDCAIFTGLPEMLNDSQYLTPRLTWEQRRAAIEGPARVCGDKVEPTLVGRLLNDMGAEPDELPLMQHVLMRLWTLADEASKAKGLPPGAGGRLLRLDDYEKLGGLAKCLDHHAEVIFATLTEGQKLIAEKLFRCLSERDVSRTQARHRDIRRPTKLAVVAALANGSDKPAEQLVFEEQVASVVTLFGQEGVNFLTMTPEKLIDVSHESLIRRWERLQKWVSAESRSAETYRRLVDRAQTRERGDSEQYLDAALLRFYLAWKQEQKPTEPWAERYGGHFRLAMDYLAKSDQAETERVAAERAQAQAEAREQQQKRDREKKLKSMGVLLGVASVLLLLAIGAFLVAYRQAAIAGTQRNNAEIEKANALKHKRDAESETKIAKRETRISNLLRLAALAENRQAVSPQQSVLLGVEAFKHLAESEEGQTNEDAERIADAAQTAEETLRKTLANIGGKGYCADQAKITHLATSEDGEGKLRWLATAGDDGSLVLWDMQPKVGPVSHRRLSFGIHYPITWLKISPDGRWLVAQSGSAHLLTLWDLHDVGLDCRVLPSYGNVQISPEGRWLVTHTGVQAQKGAIGRAKLVDLRQNNPLRVAIEILFEEDLVQPVHVVFSQKGHAVALLNADGAVDLCDLKSLPPGEGTIRAERLKGEASTARSVAFSNDSSKVTAFLSNGMARTWQDTADGWRNLGADKDLTATFKERNSGVLSVNVAADAQGALAVVSRRTSSGKAPVNQAANAPVDLPSIMFPGQSVRAKSVALLFGMQSNLFPKPLAQLEDQDEAIDWTQPIQTDLENNWLVAKCFAENQGLRIWNLKDTHVVKPATAIVPAEGVAKAALSSNGRWLVTSSGPENFVRLWDLWAQGYSSTPKVLRGHDGVVSTFALSQTNKWLITGGIDGTIRVWDLGALSTSAEPTILRNRAAQPTMVVTPDRRWLALSDSHGGVGVWDLHHADYQRRPHFRLPCFNTDQFPVLKMSRDGRFLATFGSSTGWFASSSFPGTVLGLLGIAVKTSPQDKAVLWRMDGEVDRKPFCELHDLRGTVRHFSVSADGGWIVAELEQVVDNQPRRSVKAWSLAGSRVTLAGVKIAKSVDLPLPEFSWGFVVGGKYLLTDSGYRFRLWDVTSDKAKEIKPAFGAQASFKTDDVIDAHLSPGGEKLIVMLKNGSGKLYDLTAIAAGRMVEKDLDRLGQLYFFGAKDRWVVGTVKANTEGSHEKTFVWDLASSDVHIRPLQEENRTRSFFTKAWRPIHSPDRRWLVTYNPRGESILWDLSPKKSVLDDKDWRDSFDYTVLPKGTSWVQFTRDSTRIVTIVSGYIEVRNLAVPGAPLVAKRQDKNFRGMLRDAAISPDQRTLALLGEDNLIRVFDLRADEDRVRPTLLANGPVTFQPTDLFLSANGRRVISVDESNDTLRISRVPIKELMRIAETTVGRNLSADEWAQLRLPGDYRPTFLSFNQRIDAPTPSPVPEFVEPKAVATDKTLYKAKQLADIPLLEVSGQLTANDPIDPVRKARQKPYSVKLKARNTYVIEMQSLAIDSFLRLEGRDGTVLEVDDDGGGFPNARITFYCPKDDDYKIIASSFGPAIGKFVLSVRETAHGRAMSKVSDHLPLREGKHELRSRLTADDFEDTEWRGSPSKVFTVHLTDGDVCQVDLVAGAFEGYLRLEDAAGNKLDEGKKVGQANPRIIMNCTRTGIYRIVVVSRDKLAGEFKLSVRAR